MSEEYDRYKVPYETNLGDYMDEMRVRFYDGIEVEQERIIKLLEERTLNKNEEGVTLDLQYVKDGLYGSVSLTPEITEKLIELIKGEANE
jgi:hypothetical protein